MVETMITIYILICAAMIIFDCLFMAVMSLRHHVGKVRLEKSRAVITGQLANLMVGRPIEEGHDKKMILVLQNSVLLHRFSEVLEIVKKEIRSGDLMLPSPYEEDKLIQVTRWDGEKYFKTYMEYLAKGTAEVLFERYRRKDLTVYTYYVGFLKKHGWLNHISSPSITAYLKDLLEDGDIHVCENVLQAIYAMGDPSLTVQALKIVDRKETFIHPKIISDGLLSYVGNAHALQTLLLDEREQFSIQMQVNILNYIRFASGAHCERMFDILQTQKADDEVKFSCIRYFGKYPYDPVYPLLKAYVAAEYSTRNEYCLISLTALRNYPGKETTELLKKNLRSTNWYIRYNAAESLSALGVEYGELVEIFDGKDSYARDIMQFQFDRRHAKEGEVISL